jgi:hypothetical protein
MKVSLFASIVIFAASAASADQAVIIDGWWSKDYAKESCRLAKALGCENGTACSSQVAACSHGDADGEVANFLAEVRLKMAQSQSCDNVTVALFSQPGDASKAVQGLLAGPHKTLIVDYVPGAEKQSWDLNGLQGRGGADEIAEAVCAVASG